MNVYSWLSLVLAAPTPEGCPGWVDLCGWLHIEMVHLYSHPSTNQDKHRQTGCPAMCRSAWYWYNVNVVVCDVFCWLVTILAQKSGADIWFCECFCTEKRCWYSAGWYLRTLHMRHHRFRSTSQSLIRTRSSASTGYHLTSLQIHWLAVKVMETKMVLLSYCLIKESKLMRNCNKAAYGIEGWLAWKCLFATTFSWEVWPSFCCVIRVH